MPVVDDNGAIRGNISARDIGLTAKVVSSNREDRAVLGGGNLIYHAAGWLEGGGGGPPPGGVKSVNMVNMPPFWAPVRWKWSVSPNASFTRASARLTWTGFVLAWSFIMRRHPTGRADG